ncbi:LuxR family transcriptional regulator [Kineosporia sp. NBRC 101731]|uniref:helix-turn-helix transcriptional regulator n=1 Tax=Kineosporia sp. NBRC 101731 TaxID=3032199 RepID=UPI0024A15D6C|nr:LuxR family transcriptional regulator [Kineosporia sp. NBRC 101731]GLY28976.1 transcriptional regulator [Kineosporia sp. NBRC 101731]
MGHSAGLLGRQEESGLVTRLVREARHGRGGALLIVGDPGIGKTTLLQATTGETAEPTGMRLVRVHGFEAESQMPFAAVQRLVIPLRGYLPALPERHLRALEVASGTAAGPPPDRFLIGLSVLSLLAAAGAQEPVLCSVDDAHLLDPESLDALAFVARRLEVESAALVLAARDSPAVEAHLAGVPRLRLGGLSLEHAVRLLGTTLPEPIDPAVAAQIAVATGGNPLALTDLAQELTVRQLTESSLGDEPFPVGRRLESFYLRQVRALEPGLQKWLLVAATDATGDHDLISEAAAKLGLPDGAAEGAEAAGLVELGSTVRFRHPLVRSAAYNAPVGRERRQVHRALSEVADSMGLLDLGAWHAAKATLGTDPAVARRLEQTADRAGERGGFSSRAGVLTQAGALTPPGPERYRRLVTAAEAALAAGTAQLAKDLVDDVDEDDVDEPTRARLLSLRAQWALFTADPALVRCGADLMEAADLLHGHDDAHEQKVLLQAWELSLPAERLTSALSWEQLGHRAERAARLEPGIQAVLLEAVSAHLLLPFEEAVPVMRHAANLLVELPAEELLRFGHSGAALGTALWDEQVRRKCLERWAQAARDAGSLQQLDSALWVLSLTETSLGNPRAATGYMEQVRELRRAIGYEAEHVINVALLAWTGVPRERVLAMAEATRSAGFGGVHSSAIGALASIDLAGSRFREAYDLLLPIIEEPFFHTTPVVYPDFIEAAVRSGHTDQAQVVLDRLQGRALACATPWVLGVTARCQALLAPGPSAEKHFREALEQLGESTVDAELGRTHLVYGEWLRRARRRRLAREHLQQAAQVFTRLGADAFRDRAHRELQAMGDPPAASGPADGPAPTPALTVQEATVARLAAAGRTNAEIGATMFLSTNTVDYHLRKVFSKLGISSRRQLSDRLQP